MTASNAADAVLLLLLCLPTVLIAAYLLQPPASCPLPYALSLQSSHLQSPDLHAAALDYLRRCTTHMLLCSCLSSALCDSESVTPFPAHNLLLLNPSVLHTTSPPLPSSQQLLGIAPAGKQRTHHLHKQTNQLLHSSCARSLPEAQEVPKCWCAKCAEHACGSSK